MIELYLITTSFLLELTCIPCDRLVKMVEWWLVVPQPVAMMVPQPVAIMLLGLSRRRVLKTTHCINLPCCQVTSSLQHCASYIVVLALSSVQDAVVKRRVLTVIELPLSSRMHVHGFRGKSRVPMEENKVVADWTWAIVFERAERKVNEDNIDELKWWSCGAVVQYATQSSFPDATHETATSKGT